MKTRIGYLSPLTGQVDLNQQGKQISLHRSAKGWTATTTINGLPDPEQVDLFGTATLPTAFTAAAEPAMVLKGIQRLNPDATVTINSNCL
jgi:hypothetical protein